MLRGEKVVLRAIEKSDLGRLQELSNDLETHLQSDDDYFLPRSREQVEKMFEELVKSGDGAVPLAIEADGKVIGTCGLHHIDPTSRTCSFGISIGDADYLGKGYGRDAVAILLNYAFVLRNMHKVWLTVFADNERAIRSYKALGFEQEGLQREQVWSDGRYKDWVFMGLLASDWQARRTENR